MKPYQSNKQFGQTTKKSNKSLATSRYQRQFGKGGKRQQEEPSKLDNKADEAAARRRLRQEQGEIIDGKFGYHRLEDQHQEQQNSALRGDTGISKTVQRRGWVFNMSATTVRYTLSFF